jgi:hypothetical protein
MTTNLSNLEALIARNAPNCFADLNCDPNSKSSKVKWLKKAEVLMLFPNDTTIREHARKNWPTKNISLNDFVKFITLKGGSNGPRSKCGAYMKYTHTLYNVPMFDGMPVYKDVDPSIWHYLEPSRVEHRVLYILHHALETHPLIKRFQAEFQKRNREFDYLKESFNAPLEVSNPIDRYYDKVYQKVGLAIEVQECTNRGHIDNENDVLKLTHALTNGFAVVYFKMIDYNNANVSAMNDYMKSKIKEVCDTFINMALKKFVEFREMYFMESVKINGEEAIGLFDAQIRVADPDTRNKLEQIKKKYQAFVDESSQCLLNEAYKLKKDSHDTNVRENISLEKIAGILKINARDKSRLAVLQHEFIFINPTFVDTKTMRVSWEGLMELVFRSSLVLPDNKITIMNYLNLSGRIYEDIIVRINSLDDRFKVDLGHVERYYAFLEERTQRVCQTRLVKLQKENCVLKTTNALLTIRWKQAVQVAHDISECVDTGIPIDKNLREDMEALKDIQKDMKTKVKRILTINCKDAGKSVFGGLDNFEVVYTGSQNDQMKTTDFISICNLAEWRVPARIRNKLLKELGAQKSEYVHMIKSVKQPVTEA